jgi:asparagine synthase (glutamine-hydrolysing)
VCGLAGIVGEVSPANREALRRMNGAMAHRGPDGEGFWEGTADPGGWAPMLAHRRLSILDLSTAAAQPMTDPGTGDVVVLNGEIYNYAALRASLGDDAALVESSGDTAAMLRLLSVRGVAAIDQLRGMFAIAFWHRAQRKLTLARDPAGIKPLYLARNPNASGQWSLIFASEVRALLASGLLKSPRLNPLTAGSIAWNGFPMSPETVVEGITLLEPGSLVTFDDRGNELIRRSYRARSPATNEHFATEDDVHEALEESIQLHLASDVPLGVFLSGGIDSSAVANLAHRVSGSVRTFTLAFEEGRHNEGEYARRVAAAIGTDHQEVLLTQQRFLGQLEPSLESLDQPTFDGINSYVMSRAVRDAGFKVALVGTGGDELFGGYTSFRDLPKLNAWSRRLRWLPMSCKQGVARALAGVLEPSRGEVPAQTRWAKLPDMVAHGDDLLALYQLAYALFLPDFQRKLLRHDIAASMASIGLPPQLRAQLASEIEGRSPLFAISILEQRLFLGERLLRDTDAASMAASIEVRLPLVDAALQAVVERVPEEQRFLPVRRKAMLRRVGLRGLDPALFDRPKQGFELPYAQWLRGSLGDRINDTLCDADQVRAAGLDAGAVRTLWHAFRNGAAGLYWTRIWALYVLVNWCRRHGVTA